MHQFFSASESLTTLVRTNEGVRVMLHDIFYVILLQQTAMFANQSIFTILTRTILAVFGDQWFCICLLLLLDLCV